MAAGGELKVSVKLLKPQSTLLFTDHWSFPET
jgi:hypothetical protein